MGVVDIDFDAIHQLHALLFGLDLLGRELGLRGDERNHAVIDFSRIRIRGEIHFGAELHAAQVGFAHVGAKPGMLDVADADDRGSGGDHLAGFGGLDQHNAINAVLEAMADGQDRILLTLATGTGKTAIAFQLAWKLFHSRWNLTDWRSAAEPSRRPRILFLADRNILANQAKNDFSAFPDDALARIEPAEIKKQTNTDSLESAFLALTGSTIRDETAGSEDRMRNAMRMWKK